MKVIVVSNIAQSLVNFRGPLMKGMVNRGHEVLAVAPEQDPTYASQLKALGVRYRTVPLRRASLNPLSDLKFVVSLMRLFRKEKPDVFLGYTIKPVLYGNIAAKLTRVPTRAALITGLGYTFGETTLKQKSLAWLTSSLYRFALSGAEVVFFQNPDDREEFLRRKLIPASKGKVVAGSGVDLAHFVGSTPPPPPVVFLLVARLIREKGIELYVEAARSLKKVHPDARFQLLGPYDTNPSAIPPEEIAAWEAEGVIEYLGETDDVRPFLNDASVFVLPSYYREGTPRTILEALATGRPVITTDTPGCRETVINGKNGFLVKSQDAVSLAHAMDRFLTEPDLIGKMGSESLNRAKEKYDVRLVNAEMFVELGL